MIEPLAKISCSSKVVFACFPCFTGRAVGSGDEGGPAKRKDSLDDSLREVVPKLNESIGTWRSGDRHFPAVVGFRNWLSFVFCRVHRSSEKLFDYEMYLREQTQRPQPTAFCVV